MIWKIGVAYCADNCRNVICSGAQCAPELRRTSCSVKEISRRTRRTLCAATGAFISVICPLPRKSEVRKVELIYNDFLISDDKSLIQVDRVYEFLKTAYWAESWITREIVALSIENSFCFGVYKDAVLIGFARCITDYSTMYYLADVIIDGNYRGQGLGKALMKFITEHEIFSPLLGVTETRDSHGLYEKYGFKTSKGFAMRKDPH